MGTIISVTLIAFICASICYSVAKKRKATIPFWVVMGALFGPVALPFVFMAKPKFNSPVDRPQ